MTDSPHAAEQLRVFALIEYCWAVNKDPIEAMMDLLTAACAISINSRPLRSTQEIFAESLPYAIEAAEAWFPPAKGSRVN